MYHAEFMVQHQQRQMDRETRKRQKKNDSNDEKEETAPKLKKTQIFFNNLKYTKQQWKLILINQLFSLIPLYIHIREPVIESAFLDAAATQNTEMFKEYIIEYLAIKLIVICLNPISTYISFTLDQRLSRALKEELFSHIIAQDFEFFEKYNSGELINVVNRNINQIKRQATGQGIINPFKDIIKGASSLWFTLIQVKKEKIKQIQDRMQQMRLFKIL
ncbi:ABC transporter type 1, transmembrane domain [Pseudocohnilembus persalinus]|uniref:ABC transporter type 1, transmembrane domain n=1 Tax=Pseudocohnilembus persalinus TaxID=266149 RepID=A0A0V0QA64_PSEPJ|nr:ABC transporter type 1, transmembrane domain [Pseudocohnilembus persalinus]|eukprot:KRW99073.1 ABC transporter type 1, transmembrane domain [Pseudocohnilembus persalinus]